MQCEGSGFRSLTLPFRTRINEDSDYIVSESSFNRKIVTVMDDKGSQTKIQLHEGTLKITETWKSAWQRQGAEVINLGF